MKNIFCIEHIKRKDNKHIYLAYVSCSFLAGVIAFTSAEEARLYVSKTTKKLYRKFNTDFTEEKNCTIPCNLINVYTNDDYDNLLIFDSLGSYQEYYKDYFRRR